MNYCVFGGDIINIPSYNNEGFILDKKK